jgi:tyrosyl-tRNA synthetase
MTLSEELTARGFVYQCSAPTVADVFDGEKRTVYLGIDPTADAIHVGNLVPFMMLNHIMNAGHRVILLLGGGTALIGDPSGRDTERELASVDKIKAQAASMAEGVQALSTGTITFVNNYDWLSQLSALDFMRDVGKHFTVNAMIKKDSVATRMESEQGISYTEFSYSLLQAYDYLHLHQTNGVNVQIGGSDQWGNLVSGIELVRRVTSNEVFAVTMPLVVDKATGKKFGKSMGNAVWLSRHKTTPYELYQFWLNTSDESVIDYLKLFTFLGLDQITQIEIEHNNDRSLRIAQKRLADEVVRFVHGEEALAGVTLATEVLFGSRELSTLNENELSLLMAEATIHDVPDDQPLVDTLLATGLAESKREARTFISEKAIGLNEAILTDENLTVAPLIAEVGILRRGKKHRVFVRKENK